MFVCSERIDSEMSFEKATFRVRTKWKLSKDGVVSSMKIELNVKLLLIMRKKN
jgi:hypothetical protein